MSASTSRHQLEGPVVVVVLAACRTAAATARRTCRGRTSPAACSPMTGCRLFSRRVDRSSGQTLPTPETRTRSCSVGLGDLGEDGGELRLVQRPGQRLLAAPRRPSPAASGAPCRAGCGLQVVQHEVEQVDVLDPQPGLLLRDVVEQRCGGGPGPAVRLRAGSRRCRRRSRCRCRCRSGSRRRRPWAGSCSGVRLAGRSWGHLDAAQDVLFVVGLQVAKHLLGDVDRLQLQACGCSRCSPPGRASGTPTTAAGVRVDSFHCGMSGSRSRQPSR